VTGVHVATQDQKLESQRALRTAAEGAKKIGAELLGA